MKVGDELTFDYRYYQRIDWYEDYYHELGFYDFIESLGECSLIVTTFDSIKQWMNNSNLFHKKCCKFFNLIITSII